MKRHPLILLLAACSVLLHAQNLQVSTANTPGGGEVVSMAIAAKVEGAGLDKAPVLDIHCRKFAGQIAVLILFQVSTEGTEDGLHYFNQWLDAASPVYRSWIEEGDH